MKNIFKPDEIINRYDAFDYNSYIKRGFNNLLIDLDNTICDTKKGLPEPEAKEFIDKVKKSGFRVIIYSNNVKKRVKPIADYLECEYRIWALKPFAFQYRRTIRKLNLDKSKIITMGDQIMTDVIGANWVGLYSIYTKQLVKHDTFATSINRIFERWIFKHILHENV